MENLNEQEFAIKASQKRQEFLYQLGQEILRVRSEKNLTLDRITILSGGYINKSRLEHVEIGRGEPSLLMLMALSILFNKKLTIRFE